VPFHRLGGSIKLAKLLTILDTTHWGDVEKFLINNVVPHTQYLPEGKMNLGLSVYGLHVKPSRINATGLTLKKVIKATGRPVRIVPNKTPDLSSAQVLHNNLTDERSWELLFVQNGNQTYVAQTTNVQNINAYAARDQKRPKRDAKVGMLPPKLAQIIVNLASKHVIPDGAVLNTATKPKPAALLDPFCGTGVVLQEALLMGYNTYGTDLEKRMVDYSNANLEWLETKFNVSGRTYLLEVGDATNFEWQSFDLIACETYLGRPFSAIPAPEVLREVMYDVDQIHKKFLQNVARQTKPGFRMCIAVPAWKNKFGFSHLKVLDNLGDLGYTRTVFSHVDSKDLVYHRPEQIVARELVVLTRK
jgi:SAM-dependent methyltransferase